MPSIFSSAYSVVETPHGKIRFLNHSRAGPRQVRRIITKEPDSLKWIDAMRPVRCFGISARTSACPRSTPQRAARSWAFEPAAVNYYNLVANCELNHLTDRIRCLRLGFGHNHKIANPQFMPARSFTFKQSKKLDAKRKSFPSIQAVQLWTIDKFIARHAARCPNYLKIDAPGFTPEIFAGAWKTLANPALRQIKEKGKGDPRIADLLAQFGFKPVGQEMRPGQFQREPVFARDISRPQCPDNLGAWPKHRGQLSKRCGGTFQVS
jgi:FkbM family methyltransferase